MKAVYPQGQRELTAVQSVMTNDLGEYRFFWLPPGRYYISAIPPQAEPANFGMFRMGGFGLTVSNGVDNFLFFSSANTDPALSENFEREFDSQPAERFVPVYFPGVVDEQIATALDLRAGSDFGGVNLNVTPVRERHVRGVILDGTTGKPPQYASLNMVDDVLSPIRPRTEPEVTPDTGAFDIVLLPGTHTLTAGSAGGTGYAVVRVGDTDVENVTILTNPGFNITGRMTIEGRSGNTADLAGLRISLLRNGPQFQRMPAPPSYSSPLSNGSFTLDGGIGDFRVNAAPILNLSPSRFPETVPPVLQNAYVKSIRLGNVDVLNAGLHLERAPEVPLEIVLGTNPGIIEGSAGASDISVVLLPDVRRRTDLYRTTTSDTAGRYHFDKVPPGDYKLFAWSEVEDGAWYDAEFMRNYENRGKPVHISEGSKQDVSLTVLP